MDDAVAHFSYDLIALRLEYKTTCNALMYWRGGDPAEQQFLLEKKTRSISCSGRSQLQ